MPPEAHADRHFTQIGTPEHEGVEQFATAAVIALYIARELVARVGSSQSCRLIGRVSFDLVVVGEVVPGSAGYPEALVSLYY